MKNAPLGVLALLVACGSDPGPMDVPPDPTEGSDTDAVADTDADTDVPQVFMGRCGDPVPAGAPTPPPMPIYTGGTCPTLTPGALNTMVSSDIEREFVLVVPADYDPAVEELPLLVLWHYIAGDSNGMLTHGQVQESADAYRFIAAIPERTGDLSIGVGELAFDPAWPYLNVNPTAAMMDEAKFFDDMITCIDQQYDVDENCINTTGISAGALWVSQLAQMRSQRLASIILLSGGIGPATGVPLFDVRGWEGATRAFPTLMGWGGPTDWLGVDFQTASLNLQDEMVANGHFIQECIHNCGHGVPPVDEEEGLGLLYAFALHHPYWQTPGTSIYEVEGLPEATPDWCAIGAGNATMRVGECPALDIF